MWRIPVIAVAGAVGSLALLVGLGEMRRSGPDAGLTAVYADAASVQSGMRVCVGPARITLGGEPYGVLLAFGGEGCDRKGVGLVGLRFLEDPGVPADAVRAITSAL